MKVNYHPETDSLYIDLSEQPSVESREISEGVVLDYDEALLDGLTQFVITRVDQQQQALKTELAELRGKVEVLMNLLAKGERPNARRRSRDPKA